MDYPFENKSGKLAQIHKEYRGLMHYAARAILQDEGLADEAVSESFEKIIKNFEKYDFFCPRPHALIVTIVRNTAIDIYNREKRRAGEGDIGEILPDTAPSVDEIVISMETCDAIAGLVDELPVKYREILKMSLYHGFSYKEIAEISGLSYETVKKRVYRAKLEMRKKLTESGVYSAR